ncbi:response regulator transcription factor [Pelagicoccus sp. SDUM812003]|uniref:response regulator transcription factor n=1 Tax=Pelagicoccus sp. SDUM812003 TaxID=3041267 RepID=UPI00280D47D8|nr:response regulator transcription factor [Pelagicoccus sp. SDUM812003]MDQ8202127.1 response regulator transcription factor [Pelagicoccus sp. SDUM812003]
MAIKVFIVDDHPLVRQGLAQIISSQEDLEVCGEAEDASSAMRGIDNTSPDVIIVDISLQGNNGLELIKNVKAIHETIPILVFSMHDESIYAQRALRAGAKAYVMKKESSEKIVEAIRKILKGEIYVSARVADQVLHQIVSGPSNAAASPVDRLTDRELEVVQLIGRGLSTREIAESLHLSVKTIESHRAHVKEKLNLRNATELVQFSVQWVDQQDN